VLLNGLFGNGSGGIWQEARRAGQVLVLARARRGCLADMLRFYRALRPAGRLYRAGMSWISRGGGWKCLPSRELGTGGLVAMVEQELHAEVLGVVFGNPTQRHRRAILRLKLGDGRRWVMKAGFSPESIDAVNRELAVLTRWGGNIPGVPEPQLVMQRDQLAAFAVPEVAGYPLASPLGKQDRMALLRGWTRQHDRRPLREWARWGELVARWPAGSEGALERLGRTDVARAFCHGDFAAWNLLVDSATGTVRAVDWEWAEADGIAGLDLVHGLLQWEAMVRRKRGTCLVDATLEAMAEPAAAQFLGECGWPDAASALAVLTATLNPIFTGPGDAEFAQLVRSLKG
jgi:hypothetical protein